MCNEKCMHSCIYTHVYGFILTVTLIKCECTQGQDGQLLGDTIRQQVLLLAARKQTLHGMLACVGILFVCAC